MSLDQHFSSKSSGDLALSAFKGYRQLEESILPPKLTRFSGLLVSPTRFIVAKWLSLVNHEIGGHRAQLRSLGMRANYRIDLFDGTTYHSPLKNHYESTMVALGGMHARELLSEFTKIRLLKSNSLETFYFANKLDQIVYIFSCKADLGRNKNGHDISSYIKKLITLIKQTT